MSRFQYQTHHWHQQNEPNLKNLIMSASNTGPRGSKVAHAIRGTLTLGEFLSRKFKTNEPLLGDLVLEKSFGMIAGPRGGIQSKLALLMSYSIAAGKTLKPWGVGAIEQVAYLDGVMIAPELKKSLRVLHAHNTNDESINEVEGNLHIISRDYIGPTIGFIDTEVGQTAIDKLIPAGVKLIVIDNFSAWTSGKRDDSTAVANINAWLASKRIQGIAVLLVHCIEKKSQQRGLSSLEDLLDYSILVSPLPTDPKRDDTRFTVEHIKLPDHIPELRQRYQYATWVEDEKLKIECHPVKVASSSDGAEMARMRDEDGLSLEEIGKHFGKNKSSVSRKLKLWDNDKAAASLKKTDDSSSA